MHLKPRPHLRLQVLYSTHDLSAAAQRRLQLHVSRDAGEEHAKRAFHSPTDTDPRRKAMLGRSTVQVHT